MGGADMGDLESIAAMFIRKLRTTVMGIFWQLSGTTKHHLLILNYYAIYHLKTRNQALIKCISQGLAVPYI